MEEGPILRADEPSRAQLTCGRCSEPMDAVDRFCRHCGGKRGSSTSFHDHPMVILGLLFLVIGPLALPMLWRSASFTRNQKIGISIANLAFIGAIVLAMAAVFRTYMKMILELSGV
jgi:hypothetical protein